ncbi:hypothetical protein ROZALSC1DRAFT_22893, partial [Rozella allomycis CSF55]
MNTENYIKAHEPVSFILTRELETNEAFVMKNVCLFYRELILKLDDSGIERVLKKCFELLKPCPAKKHQSYVITILRDLVFHDATYVSPILSFMKHQLSYSVYNGLLNVIFFISRAKPKVLSEVVPVLLNAFENPPTYFNEKQTESIIHLLYLQLRGLLKLPECSLYEALISDTFQRRKRDRDDDWEEEMEEEVPLLKKRKPLVNFEILKDLPINVLIQVILSEIETLDLTLVKLTELDVDKGMITNEAVIKETMTMIEDYMKPVEVDFHLKGMDPLEPEESWKQMKMALSRILDQEYPMSVTYKQRDFWMKQVLQLFCVIVEIELNEFMLNHFLQDLRVRCDLVLTWLHIINVHFPSEYEDLTTKLLINAATTLDPKDKTITRLLLELPRFMNDPCLSVTFYFLIDNA